jgi:hypothetical protein
MRRAWVLVLLACACSPTIQVGQQLTSTSRACGDAQAYVRTQFEAHCLRWAGREITWHLDAAGAAQVPGNAEVDAVARAFGHWAAVAQGCSDLRFTAGAPVANARIENDGATVVLFRESECRSMVPASDPCWMDLSCSDQYRCWDHATSTVAVTTNTFSTTTGVLVDADFELNAARFFFTVVDEPKCGDLPSANCVSTDLESAMTHEIGHALGLSHVPNETPFSTMTPISEPGSTLLRFVDASSACFVCDAYPSGLPSVDCE